MAYKPQLLSSIDGGTGVANSSTITVGGAINTANSFTTTGNFPLTLTTTASTTLTLPTSGTLATTADIGVPEGALGTVLQGQGIGSPAAYSTATYPSTAGTSGKILISDGTNIISSTPTYPNAASTALKHIKSDGTNFVTTTVTYPDASVTAGKVIVSDGTNYIASTPTFPNASATSGKVIKSDGTNWVASTETYAAPGTSGNILTSDGTNWTSASPSGYVLNMNQIGTFNPADATTYFVGVLTTGWETVATTATTQLVVPRTGTIRQVYGRVVCTAGSSQSVSIFVRVNNTTDVTITTSSNWSASPIAFNATGLTQAVSAGDFLQLKITTPTWNPTNPTAVFVTWSVFIS